MLVRRRVHSCPSFALSRTWLLLRASGFPETKGKYQYGELCFAMEDFVVRENAVKKNWFAFDFSYGFLFSVFLSREGMYFTVITLVSGVLPM